MALRRANIKPPLEVVVDNLEGRALEAFFLAFDKAKNAHMGRGALLGSKCMEIKASYVQARRFIDFHTLILNSYFIT